MTSTNPTRVAVIGAGISGLAAAWELRDHAEVTVFESSRIGGKLLTSSFAGAAVDEGPDAFLTRVPGALVLCDELDLSAELVAPRAGKTLLWSGGKLQPIPGGLVLGVPKDLRPLATSGLLSPLGIARAALDLVLPRDHLGEDASIDELIGGRFGSEVVTRLVEPLVGSIHAARTADLSAAATAPQILAAARRSRSLLLALRADGPQAPEGPVFLAPRGGLSVLVDTLVARLRDSGAVFEERRVEAVRPSAGGGVEVGGERFDGAILAVPATAAAGVLGDLAPPGLGDVPVTDVVLVTLDVVTSDLPVASDVNGILVPPAEGTLMTACSFGSNKWPSWSAQPGHSTIRISTGRHGDGRPAQLDDEALVNRLSDELGTALGRAVDPCGARVSRWPGAFPLYRVGHLSRVSDFERHMEQTLPVVALAGASYRGSGIPACITSGRSAASGLLGRLNGTDPVRRAALRRAPHP